MIRDKEVARQVSEVALKCADELALSVTLLQEGCGEEELQSYRLAVGKVLTEIYQEIMLPIYKVHPELTPPGLEARKR